MVTVEIKVDRKRQYTGFSCSGHAGYAACGSDIVCAAISVLALTIVNSLETIVRVPMTVKAEEKTGYLRAEWENQPGWSEQTQLLMRTLILGLNQIQAQYPDNITICEVEV